MTSGAAHTQFPYPRLPPDSFRLLHLSHDGDQLSYNLSDFLLDKAPDYHALSYTWDGQMSDRTLLCNGARLAITLNVQTILPYLYAKYESHYIWIDAVCINQKDYEEKNVQVPLMQMIYTKALVVVVWLGEGDAAIDEAFKEIPVMLPRLSGFDGRLGLEDHRLSSHGLPGHSSSIWRGVNGLFTRSWLSRVWVFQEVTLAKSVEVMCGDNTLDYDTLIEFAKGLSSATLMGLTRNSQTDAENTAVAKGLAMFQKISLYKKWRASKQRFSFLTLLEMGRELSATNDVDKVYGLLGLAPGSLRVNLEVDVRKSAANVFVDAAKYDIGNEPILNILHVASSNQPLEGLPSWCPNFAGAQAASRLGGHAAGHHAGFKNIIYDSFPFQATASSTDNILRVRGFHIDQITKVVAPGWNWISAPDLAPELAAAAQTLVWEDSCLNISQELYASPINGAVPEAHWRTLIANTLNNKICLSNQLEAYALMRLSLAVVSVKTRDPEHADSIGTTLTDAQAVAVEDYVRAAQAACGGRSFFSTRDGRIGLGPADSRVNDKVVVILNTWTPFVLRPREGVAGTHKLIGEAYVHGLMYSEAFDLMDDSEGESVFLE